MIAAIVASSVGARYSLPHAVAFLSTHNRLISDPYISGNFKIIIVIFIFILIYFCYFD